MFLINFSQSTFRREKNPVEKKKKGSKSKHAKKFSIKKPKAGAVGNRKPKAGGTGRKRR